MVTKIGTAGNDSLVGTTGIDSLSGLDGNDQITGLAGADLLDGGNGIDTVRYGGSAAAARADSKWVGSLIVFGWLMGGLVETLACHDPIRPICARRRCVHASVAG
jgi:Ca2+-binding RTX toxin-like protein